MILNIQKKKIYTVMDIKQKIKDKGLKLTWIAEQIGISVQLLSMKLNGKATLDKETVNKIETLLNQ